MFILLIISSTALSKRVNKIDDGLFIDHQNEEQNEIIDNLKSLHSNPKQSQNNNISENISYTQLSNNNTEKYTNHSHFNYQHRHNHHNHNHTWHHNKDSNLNNITKPKSNYSNKFRRFNRHKRNQFKHNHNRHHGNSSHIEKIQSEKQFEDKTNNFTNNVKLLNARIMKIADCIKKIKTQNSTNENESKSNDKLLENTESEFNDHLIKELIHKNKGIGYKNHHKGFKIRNSNHFEENSHRLIHQWDENQKNKLQQKIEKMEHILHEYKNNKTKDGTIYKNKKRNRMEENLENQIRKIIQHENPKSNSKEIKVIKPELYIVGGAIFIGIVSTILIVISIRYKKKKSNDDSNVDFHDTNENDSSQQVGP